MPADLVVPLTSTLADDDALAVAVDLAAHFRARLTVLEIVHVPLPSVDCSGLMVDLPIADMYSRLRAEGEVNVARRKASLQRDGLQVDVRLVDAVLAGPERTSAFFAHAADLVVVAGGVNSTVEGETAHGYISALLLESGRPVLVVPPRARLPLPPEGVLLAWFPNAQATRAMHDALPLLRRAKRIDVMVVDQPSGGGWAGQRSDADVAAHLGRHGLRPNVVVRQSRGRDVADLLLEHAREMPAQLIVAGGYGHSKLREWVLGGTTRDLLVSSRVPLLLSH